MGRRRRRRGARQGWTRDHGPFVLAVIGVAVLFFVMSQYQPGGGGGDTAVEDPTPQAAPLPSAPTPPPSVEATSEPAVVQTPETTPATTTPPTEGRVAVVIGDAYTRAGGSGDGYATHLADELGWDQVIDASGQAVGYVEPEGDDGQSFAARVEPDVVPHDPDLVVVTGGAEDAGHTSRVLRSAAAEAFDAILDGAPQAAVVVVGPLWHDGAPPVDVLAVRDAVEAIARARGLPFIDPLAEGWITGTGTVDQPAGDGNADEYVAADGVHLTEAGLAHVAQRVAAHLGVLGLAEPEPVG